MIPESSIAQELSKVPLVLSHNCVISEAKSVAWNQGTRSSSASSAKVGRATAYK